MNLLHLTPHDYCISQWSGGSTTQIAIAPKNAIYADRDFLWRISSASVELEESDFTSLPDYDRWISTLSGTMILSHNGGERITLLPYQVHSFDGGAKTHSWGRCTDFNLMLRKGKVQGSVRSLQLAAGEQHTVAFTGKESDRFPHSSLLLFCGKGSAAVALGEETIRINPFEAVLLQDTADHTLTIESPEGASLFIAQMQSI